METQISIYCDFIPTDISLFGVTNICFFLIILYHLVGYSYSVHVHNLCDKLKNCYLFNWIINNNRDMWQHKSKILTPLSSVTPEQVKWNWSNKCQKAFDTIKKLFLVKLCFLILTLMNHLKLIQTLANYSWDQ